MKNKILDEIQIGLEEARTNLVNWVETTPEEKIQVCLGPEDETCIEEHLHVIDESLEKIEEGTFGICKICHEPVDRELLQMDYTASVCLGHFTDEELRQLESELELSQVIQRGLLPQTLPSIDGLNIAAFSRPAQIVGGDYFDFMNFKDGAPRSCNGRCERTWGFCWNVHEQPADCFSYPGPRCGFSDGSIGTD